MRRDKGTKTRRWICRLSLGLGLVALPLGAQDSAPKGRDAPGAHDAADVFQNNCQNCHTVPDKRSELDRAWLGQVLRTS